MNERGNIKFPPLLKWPGGKRGLLSAILPLVPNHFNRYFEPFVGGGALFFALQPPRSRLSDRNAELIYAYSQVRDRPKAVIDELRKLKNSESDYYCVRATVPKNPAGRAARFIYLITLAFNGIYRVNLKGQFNVPYGFKTYIDPCNEGRIREASEILAGATLRSGDFEQEVDSADQGDFVYLDPPYTVTHGNNGFLKYNAKIFSWDDQMRLARAAHALANKGCSVFVSNANHPSIRKMYQGFQVLEITRHSVIAASSQFRRAITECIFYNR